VQTMATTTDISIRKIHAQFEGKISRGGIGKIVKQVRQYKNQG